MATYDLKAFQQNAIGQLEELQGAIRLDDDLSNFRKVTRMVCDNFMTLAAASLLADMKPDLFFQNLWRSADNWRRYLLSCAGHYDKPPTLLYNSPLYAAIVTDDSELLAAIAKALPKSWQQGEEYEDQFIISKLLLSLSQNGQKSDRDVETSLVALEACEEDSTQSDLVKALLGLEDLKESDFWSYFETALYAHEEVIQDRVSSFTTKVTHFIPHRYIWYNGVVWLRLAIKKGFVLPSKSIMFCPDEALDLSPRSYKKDWLLIPEPNGVL